MGFSPAAPPSRRRSTPCTSSKCRAARRSTRWRRTPSFRCRARTCSRTPRTFTSRARAGPMACSNGPPCSACSRPNRRRQATRRIGIEDRAITTAERVMPVELKNPVIERMRAGDVSLGMIVRLARSGDIARIAKTTGHDFIFIDRQHSLFSLETVGHIAQAALGCGVAPLVRVRSCEDPDISLLLDGGATGIVFPDVSSAADARRALDACKFPPLGKRSIGGGYPILDLRPVPVADSMRLLNESTLVVCMIETRESLANIEDIAAVDG